MNRIEKLFKDLRKQKRKALIVYLTAGYPSLSLTEKLVPEIEKSGADLIELGIPFSDPLADGQTIQKASQAALSKGVTARSILKTVRKIRRKSTLPIVFMTYYNLVVAYGVRKFVKDAKKSGVDGIIIPDLPVEESGELVKVSRKIDFSTIFLAAPTSTESRIKNINSKSTGFIYYVSLTGVTGERRALPSNIVNNIKKLKKLTTKPVCVGFGISNAEQAKKISRLADGVIVGSAVIKVIEKNIGKKNAVHNVALFTGKLAKAVHEN